MVRLSGIIEELENLAPPQLAESWDNVGLHVGNADDRIQNVYVCLEITSENVKKAVDFGADLIVSHHPLIFRPLRCVVEEDVNGGIIRTLISNNISAYCMHTNFDKADGGMNDLLAQKLGLENVRKFTADECVDESGKPLDEIGRVGTLEYPMSFEDFIEHTKSVLSCRALRYMGDIGETVQTVALCSGSGGDYIYSAYHSGADAYVTADLGHHDAQAARELGLNIIDAGHFETENIICEFLHEFLYNRFPDLNVKISDAEPYFTGA